MINIVNIEITETVEDEESGDVYHSVEATLLEPGGFFSETLEEKTIKQKVRDCIDEYNNIIGEITE